MISDFLNSNAATGLIGIVGVLVGLFGERWLRSRGELRCVIGGVRYTPVWMAGDGSTTSASENPNDLPESGVSHLGTLRVTWIFELRFFNEKDEPTGLHAVSVAFLDAQGETTAMIGPLGFERGRSLRLRDERHDLPDLINLPSQQWASLRINGVVGGPNAVSSLRWERIEVRAEHPNGEPYMREVDNRRKKKGRSPVGPRP